MFARCRACFPADLHCRGNPSQCFIAQVPVAAMGRDNEVGAHGKSAKVLCDAISPDFLLVELQLL